MRSESTPPVAPPRIALVDDDQAVLRSVSRMLTVCGYDVSTFRSADAFLFTLEATAPEVLIVDLRMPGRDGFELQAAMFDRGYCIPTIFLSGHGDVPSSVRAIRAGAIDFLEKPCDEATLLAALERATDAARRNHDAQSALTELTTRLNTLTHREREVFRWIVTGRLNKQIAAALGTTEKTVKVHRARVFAKMRADSVADLVRMFDLLGETPVDGPRATPRRGRPRTPPWGLAITHDATPVL